MRSLRQFLCELAAVDNTVFLAADEYVCLACYGRDPACAVRSPSVGGSMRELCHPGRDAPGSCCEMVRGAAAGDGDRAAATRPDKDCTLFGDRLDGCLPAASAAARSRQRSRA